MKKSSLAHTIKSVLTAITVAVMTHTASAASVQPSPELQTWIKHLMREYHVPGASIAVVKNHKIKWAKGFGYRDKKNHLPVTNDTLFQAASISKPVTAIAALEIFHDKELSIDSDINTILKSWKIPPNQFSNKQAVTLRLLLSHTAGITGVRETGYPTNHPFPTTLQGLNGTPPANTPAVVLVRSPNTKYEYSPAGYTIVQTALTDLEKKPFASIMENRVLVPLHMNHSTFIQPLPSSYYQNMAWPYLPDGTIPPHSPYAFPQAAGGLWTTPSDLAQFLIAIQKALSGKSTAGITPDIANEMMKPGLSHNMGMGMEVNINQYGEMTEQQGHYFRHAGSQTGYLSMMMGSKRGGNGVIIMINTGPYMTAKDVPQYAFLAKTMKHISEIEHWGQD